MTTTCFLWSLGLSYFGSWLWIFGLYMCTHYDLQHFNGWRAFRVFQLHQSTKRRRSLPCLSPRLPKENPGLTRYDTCVVHDQHFLFFFWAGVGDFGVTPSDRAPVQPWLYEPAISRLARCNTPGRCVRVANSSCTETVESYRPLGWAEIKV